VSFPSLAQPQSDIDKHHCSSHFVGTVLLHLYAGAIARRLQPSEEMKPIHSIYIPVPSPFPSLEAFILKAEKTYNLDLFSCRSALSQVDTAPTTGPGDAVAAKAAGKITPGEGMLHALEIYKERFPQVTAILIGTRRTDPHGGTFTPRLLPAIFVPADC
jgi:FAD synthetase